MKINITKSHIPIIRLDTFFLIDYNKNVKGIRKDNRFVDLYNLIKEKVNSKKLICARAEQEDEIDDDVELTLKYFFALSKDFQFKSSYQINNIQNRKMMEFKPIILQLLSLPTGCMAIIRGNDIVEVVDENNDKLI